MTVAAVILSATAEGALTEALGQPRVRRLADIAWSGGAMPVLVLSPERDGEVARALNGAEAEHHLPASPESGPIGQMIRGSELAQADVHGTTAVLLWPARMTWVGPETVTSLIEAHGVASDKLLRPTWRGEAGWPLLVPLAYLDSLRAIDPTLMPDAIHALLSASIPTVDIEVGDPGVHHDADTPYHELPAYEGPPDPPAGHTHEWGEDVVEEAGLPPAPDELD